MAVGKKDNSTVRAVGRRKTAVARVKITVGTGDIAINGKNWREYFPIVFWQDKVIASLRAVSKEKDLDLSIKVNGGGVNAQAEAVRHGIARALVEWNEEFKPILKAEGFLTRDPRAKERKKPGLHRARRGHQWRKR